MENYSQFASSNIARIGYESNQNLLEVEFLNGSIYQYFDVPYAVWEEFKLANSKGTYLAQSIKSQYRYSKV